MVERAQTLVIRTRRSQFHIIRNNISNVISCLYFIYYIFYFIHSINFLLFYALIRCFYKMSIYTITNFDKFYINPLFLQYFLLAKQILLAKYKDRKSTRLNSSHANISYAVF